MDPITRKASIRETLTPKFVAEPLRSKLSRSTDPNAIFHVIVELDMTFSGARKDAYDIVAAAIATVTFPRTRDAMVRNIDGATHPYLFASLAQTEIFALVNNPTARPAMFRMWESTAIHPLTTVSIKTVKSDACHLAFSASGTDIVWAVLDSGIDGKHPHFIKNNNLDVPKPLVAESFVPGPHPCARRGRRWR